jgi:hypothetical protein
MTGIQLLAKSAPTQAEGPAVHHGHGNKIENVVAARRQVNNYIEAVQRRDAQE